MKNLGPFLLPTLLVGLSCSQDPGKEAVATVGDQTVSVAQLQLRLRSEGGLYDDEILSNPEGARAIKKRLLKALIEEELLAQEAERKGILLSPEEEKRIADLATGLPIQAIQAIQAMQAMQAFRERGLTAEDWISRQKLKRRIDILIDREVMSKIEASEKEIRETYARLKREFREPDRIRCRQITTAKREKAETILSLLQKGENFAAVAQKYSESPDREQGGDLGPIARGEVPPPFEAACFTLATGQVSDIVSSDYGFHIFKVTEKKPGGGVRPLKEVREEVIRRIREAKKDERLRAWLESLHAATPITIDDKMLEAVVVPLSWGPS